MNSDSSWDDLNQSLAIEVVRRLQENGFVAYFAGGCVRDQLLALIPSDYDVATNASPEQIIQIFGRQNTLMIGAAFGVACVHRKINNQIFNVEVATFRSDGEYLDGRRPSSVRFATPRDDAQRRDFTINGIFYDPIADQLHDFVGGEVDLRNKIVRAIGDAGSRIAEDKLRMIRAIRFAAKYGFRIDPATRQAVCDNATQLHVVSAERIADELSKICLLGDARWALEQLYETRLLTSVWPRLDRFWQEDQAAMSACLDLIDASAERTFSLALASCTLRIAERSSTSVAEIVQELVIHLKLSNEIAKEVTFAASHAREVLAADKLLWSQVQPLAIDRNIQSAIALARTLANAEKLPTDGVEYLEQKRQLSKDQLDPASLIDGRTLQELGYAPGPIFKTILEEVRTMQLDGMLRTTSEAQLWLQQHHPIKNLNQ